MKASYFFQKLFSKSSHTDHKVMFLSGEKLEILHSKLRLQKTHWKTRPLSETQKRMHHHQRKILEYSSYLSKPYLLLLKFNNYIIYMTALIKTSKLSILFPIISSSTKVLWIYQLFITDSFISLHFLCL